MSLENRTVSNGRNFPAAIYADIMAANTFCVCCKKEKAIHADHIKPLIWGGKSTRKNGLALCGRCHWEKSKIELNIKTRAAQRIHVKKWKALAFTPKGKNRTMTTTTIAKNASYAKRINRAKMQARMAKTPEAKDKAHKLAAKIRREFKAAA